MFPLFMKRGFSIPRPNLSFWHFGTKIHLNETFICSFTQVPGKDGNQIRGKGQAFVCLATSSSLSVLHCRALSRHWGLSPATGGILARAGRGVQAGLWVQPLCHWGGEEYVAALSHVGDKQELEGHTALGMGTGNSCVTWMCFPTCLRCRRQLPRLCRAPANSGKGLFCYMI